MDNMSPDQPIPPKFSEELEDVRSRVLQMGGIVEQQLNKAVDALTTGNAELARQVVADDAKVNGFEVDIDEECTRILAQRRHTPRDLRLVMAVIKTISDLERIGDEAKRVGRMVQDELDGVLEEEVRQQLEHMGELVRNMLRQALDAFARTDMQAAIRVHRADREADARYKSISRQLMTYMAADSRYIPTILNVLWAARSMERMGDRCQNIAEYVIYFVHGKDVRHTNWEDILRELESSKPMT